MKQKLFIFTFVFIFSVFFYLNLPIFSGHKFCLPGFVDKGPGTIGCFESVGAVDP